MIFKPWDCAQPDEWLPQSLRLCWGGSDSGSGWSGDSGGGGWSGDTGGGWGGATTGGGDWGSSGTYDASGFNAGGDVNAWAGTAYDASTAGTGAGGGGDWGSFGTASFPDSSPGAIFTDIAGPNPGVTTGGGDWGSAGTSSFAGTGGGPGGSMFGDYGGGGGGGGGGGFWGSTESGGGSYGGGGGTYGGGGGGGGAFGAFGSGTLGGSNAYAAAPTGPTGSAFADSYGGGSLAGPAGQVSSGAPTTSEAQSESAGGGETTSEGDAAPEGETAPAQSDFGTPTTSEAAPEADPGPSLSDGAPAGNIGGKDDAAPAAAPTADRGETETSQSAFGPQSLDADYQGSPYASDYDQGQQAGPQQDSFDSRFGFDPNTDTTNWGSVFEGAAPNQAYQDALQTLGDLTQSSLDPGQPDYQGAPYADMGPAGQQQTAPNFDQAFQAFNAQPGWNPAEQMAGQTGLVEGTDWAANPYQPSTDVAVGRDFNQAFDAFGDTPTGMDLAGDLATPEGDINPNSTFQLGWEPANAYAGRGPDDASGRAAQDYFTSAVSGAPLAAAAPGLLAALSAATGISVPGLLGGSAITGGGLLATQLAPTTTPIAPQQQVTEVELVSPQDVPAPPPPQEQQPQEAQPTQPQEAQPAQQTPQETQQAQPQEAQPAQPQQVEQTQPQEAQPAPPSLIEQVQTLPAEVQPAAPPSLIEQAQPGVPMPQSRPAEAPQAPQSLVDMLPPPALTPPVQPSVPMPPARPADASAAPPVSVGPFVALPGKQATGVEANIPANPTTGMPAMKGIDTTNNGRNGGTLGKVEAIITHFSGGKGYTIGSLVSQMMKGGAGYNIAVDKDGTAYQLRPNGVTAGHVGDKGKPSGKGNFAGYYNNNSIGVAALAENEADLTPAQIATMKAIVTALGKAHNIPPSQVFGHAAVDSNRGGGEGSTVAGWAKGLAGWPEATDSRLASRPPADVAPSRPSTSPRPPADIPTPGRITFYAPGGKGKEGGYETSRPNPTTGKYTPSTLDDVRLGKSPFVTVAADPSRYGENVNLGTINYKSPIDGKTYTLDNVQGIIHDTGSAFKGRLDKLDVAVGDFRGWSLSKAQAFVANNSRQPSTTSTATNLPPPALTPPAAPPQVVQPRPPADIPPATTALPPPDRPLAPETRPPADIPVTLTPPRAGRAEPALQARTASQIAADLAAKGPRPTSMSTGQIALNGLARALAQAGIPAAIAQQTVTETARAGSRAAGYDPDGIASGYITSMTGTAMQGYQPSRPGAVQGPPAPEASLRGLAKGGHVAKDEPVVVGEEGPEYFVPDQPGTVFPHMPQTGKSDNVDRWPKLPAPEYPGRYGGVEREINRQTRAAQDPVPTLMDMVDSGRLPLNAANWDRLINNPSLIALGRSRMDDRREGIDPGAEQYGAFIPAPAPAAAEPPDPTSQMAQALGYSSIKRRPMQIGRQSYSQ